MKTNRPDLIQAYQQAPWRVQIQFIGLFTLGVVMIGLVAGVYLNVTARAATIGRQIQGLQNDILVLERENADLETQLAQLTSAESMEQRAKELGFQTVDPRNILYLEVTGYPGRQEVVLAPPPGPIRYGPAELPPEFTQTLFDWVREFALDNTGPLRQGQP